MEKNRISNIASLSAMNHHFTVVETVEAGRPMLVTVPHQWVQGNTLYWPSKKSELIRKNAASIPLTTWNKMNCRIKRKCLPSFEAAELEAAELSGVTTDTEVVDVKKIAKRKKILKTVPAKKPLTASKFNFNQHFSAEGSSQSQNSISVNCSVPAAQTITSPVQLPRVAQEEPFSAPPEQPLLELETIVPKILQGQIPLQGNIISGRQELDDERLVNTVIQKIDDCKEEIKQHVSTTMETLLVKTIAAVKSDFDAKLEVLYESKQAPHAPNHLSSFKFKPVGNAEELIALEDNLENQDYTQKLMTYMKGVIRNTPDTVNGQNVCYELVDKFFTRPFMIDCSWTGLSRSGGLKVALKTKTKILNVIFAIVKSVNEHFCVKAMEDLIKSVLRNARKRAEAKNIRQSAVKRRGKKSLPTPYMVLQVGQDQVVQLDNSTLEGTIQLKTEITKDYTNELEQSHSEQLTGDGTMLQAEEEVEGEEEGEEEGEVEEGYVIEGYLGKGYVGGHAEEVENEGEEEEIEVLVQ